MINTKVRNIAIVAHVDHGKTTLVDSLLKQTTKSNKQIENRAMDNLDLEKERGITILSKNTAVYYEDIKINILDTPGHHDFGGEVERIVNMVEAICLVVDANEGVMPQTKFVLDKALKAKLQIIVVLNKMDRPVIRPKAVIDELYELFMNLNATDEQLDFPIVYASASEGLASLDEKMLKSSSMDSLLKTIVDYVKPPKVSEGTLQFQPAILDYNDYVGRIGIGKIFRGKITINQMASVKRGEEIINFRIQKIYGFDGLNKVELKEASGGDIVAIAGLSDLTVGETVNDQHDVDILPALTIQKPTIEMLFLVNKSPFAGLEGKFVTSSKLEERLNKEAQKDVSLIIEKVSNDSWLVKGRGELHLSILIETMKREGYEFAVAKPNVITIEENNIIKEPFELVTINVPEQSIGSVIELFTSRKGQLLDLQTFNGNSTLLIESPSKSLIGIKNTFLSITFGEGVINHTFSEYKELVSNNVNRKTGSLVANNEGEATAYALHRLEDRGVMFIEPRDRVYQGMIVGESNKNNDLHVNVTQGKQLTNVRSATKDATVVLRKARLMTLEMCMSYINDDELIEITPKSIRLRKKI